MRGLLTMARMCLGMAVPPFGAAEGVGLQPHVFQRDGKVNGGKRGGRQALSAVHRHDHHRRTGGTAGVGGDGGQRLNFSRVSHHIKFPGLLVAGAGGLHSGPENLEQGLFFHRLAGVFAHADAMKNAVHGDLLVLGWVALILPLL